MIPDWLISFAAGVTLYILIPTLLLFSVALPFLVVKRVLKKRFTVLTVLTSVLVASGLVAVALYGLYWGFAYLQGYAACSLYGC